MTLGFRGIHHISVPVADTGRALAFYRGVLGLELNDSRPAMNLPGAWLDIGEDQQIHLLEVLDAGPVAALEPASGRERHFALRVGDLARVRVALDAAGIGFSSSRSGRAALFCRDPDGNVLEFVQLSSDPVTMP